MLLVGLIVILVGVADLVIAGVYARREATAGGVPGAQPASPFAGVLRRTGYITIAVGVVLAVIGLLS